MTPPRPDAPVLLREFLRVSKDSSGREKSPNQQHDDHVRDTGRHNFQLHQSPYREIGSASRYAKKARDEFPLMIADLQAGRFDADGLALWEGSRGSRKVSEWALLLDLLAEGPKWVWIHTHGRMYDATNHRDRRTLLEEAVDAEYESGKTSDRTRRDHADRAAEGGPAGRISWGYRSLYDDRTGKLVQREPDHESGRVELVNELFKRFASGETLKKIEREWAARGIVNGKGNPFGASELRCILRNRVYIGERVYVPGRVTRWWRARDEALITTGQWEPIVDRELFLDVQAILDDPDRLTMRPGGARHMLSMIALCDPCSGPMTVKVRHGNWRYICQTKGCTTVSKPELEAVGLSRIEDYLSSKHVHDSLRQADERDGEELAQVWRDISLENAELANLKARTKAGELTIDFAASVEPGIRARLAKLEKRRKELQTPPELRGLVGPREEVRARLASIDDVGRLRRIARLVLSSPLAGEMRVLRSPSRGHRVPVKDRVEFLRE
jgi:DNA invertase Pin-like site-specific DNA recombinase